jgi:hypothetical protein
MSQQLPFPGHSYLFSGKLLFRKITLLLYFLEKFSREFTLSFNLPVNNKKPTERQRFSMEIQRQKF